MKTSPASRIQSNLKDLFQANVSPGVPYVRFQLSSDIHALLSMQWVEESLVVEADKITPLPAMPTSIIGIMNSRDHVFCALDLPHLLSIPTQIKSFHTYQVIVINASKVKAEEDKKELMGFVVNQIQGIVRISESEILNPIDLPECFSQFTLGYTQKDGMKNLILDPHILLEKLQTSSESLLRVF